MTKKGDTLIEVTLAIGIFSMIAIGVAAVMSSGTSGAQTALETTLTREEIDTQAEALRFIQTAYTIDKNSTDKKFSKLWEAIRNNAIDNISQLDREKQEKVLQYSPSSCNEVLSDEYIRGHAFVINPRKFGTFTADSVDSVYIPASSGKLTTASIYPRLVFSPSSAVAPSNTPDQLVATSSAMDSLYRAEGLYVLAVKDSGATQGSGTTSIVGDMGVNKAPAYYDFYIRACWYGTDANEPSTISTVIRLYDPDTTE